MNKKLKAFTNQFNHIDLILILIYTIYYILFIDIYPSIQMDEPWYANTAYNFSIGNGFNNTNIGYRGGDVFIMFSFISGVIYKIFGCSLIIARFVSVLGGIISALFFLKIINNMGVRKNIKYLAFIIFMMSNVFYIIFRSVRPEGWILTFGIISIYYMIKILEDYKLKDIILLSFFSTLAFLVHPNGILFLGNASILVLIESIKRNNIKNILIYGGVSVFLMAIPFIYIFSDAVKLNEFLIQARERNTFGESKLSIYENFVSFINTYVLGIKRLFILIFEIGILFYTFFFIKSKTAKYLALFGLFNFLFSIIVFNPYISRSFSQIIIYSYICMIIVLNHTSFKSIRYKLIIIACVLFLVNNAAGNFYILYKNRENTSHKLISNEIKKISSQLNQDDIVLSILQFWFPLKDIDFYSSYTFYKYKDYANLKDLLSSGNVKYIVFSPFETMGKTVASGRNEDVPKNVLNYYNQIKNFTEQYGILVKEIDTHQYGKIKIWKIAQ